MYNIIKKLVSVGNRVKVFLRFVGGILEVPYPEFLLILLYPGRRMLQLKQASCVE